ncbi:unnamed protein product, partial [Polarella glacialis]
PSSSSTAWRAVFEGTQFLVGEAVLFAPVLEQGARARLVYLPGKGTLWAPCLQVLDAQDAGLPAPEGFSGQQVVEFPVPLNATACFLRLSSPAGVGRQNSRLRGR